MPDTVRVAAIQAEPSWMDLEGTTRKTIDLIEKAAAEGADIVGFPEVWLPCYPVFLIVNQTNQSRAQFMGKYHANSVTIDGDEMMRIRTAARDNRIAVVLGFSERSGGSLYMSQVIIGTDGDVLLHRRKLKPTSWERMLFGESDGSGIRVIDTPLGRIGALNCGEHLQPLVKYAMYSQNEQIHFASWPCLGIAGDVPSISPEGLTAVTRVYAHEGSAFVVMSTQIMSEAGALAFPDLDGALCPVYTGGGGYARVYGPDSSVITEPLDPTQDGIVHADVDLSLINLAKHILDPAGHYARPDVLQLVFDDRPRRPVIRPHDVDSQILFPPLPTPEMEFPAPDGAIDIFR